MSMLVVVLSAAVLLTTAYFTYGSLLSRLLKLDAQTPTPAVEMRDDVDYAPIEPKFLLSQHFSAIAAAGPIVGPILAGLAFGWLPALIWILVGSIFIGGVHDMTALTASIRHKARSIAEVVRDHMSHAVLPAVPGVRMDCPGLYHRGFYRRHGWFVRGARQRRERRRLGRRHRQQFAVVPGVADHHGPAAALHAACRSIGPR